MASVAPWYALLGGGAAWAAHLVVGYMLKDVACKTDRLAGTTLGVGNVHALGLALSVIAAVVAFSAASVAWAMAGGAIQIDPVDEAGAPETLGRRRFIAYVGVVMNGLLLLAIVIGGPPFVFLSACSGS